MKKLVDIITIVKASMEKTKEVVGWLTAMGRDFGSMVAELRGLFPKKKQEATNVDAGKTPDSQKDNGETT